MLHWLPLPLPLPLPLLPLPLPRKREPPGCVRRVRHDGRCSRPVATTQRAEHVPGEPCNLDQRSNLMPCASGNESE
ncbi:hypothetical protein CAI18_11490 [Xanthomonas citri pv. punicae]|nr:hypothetical protein CAI14_09695 [Xanthomonas citri pv. punicae]QCZ68527.1 hypothetical protein CAI17_07325 [Xanthomonas citri pv. punicae]QCZ71720.1 hypothetical protein CAB38_01510 [Xanthomonas citri pv. punicae]QCZ77016.1 hypothetical protein XapA_09455 [Xanthomonas citri pv. punicae]QCZ85604.1 hypothetical protein CAI18_11490 [Xanthomonas citri pv. punicae]